MIYWQGYITMGGVSDMTSYNNKLMIKKSRGFGLVELLTVIVILAILAGMSMLVMGRSADNAEAAKIMGNLDAARNALLAYSMEHRTRTSDRLDEFIAANTDDIIISLDKYLDRNVTTGQQNSALFSKIQIGMNPLHFDGQLAIGFIGFDASSGLRSALAKRTGSDSQYDGSSSGGTYSLWIKVKK